MAQIYYTFFVLSVKQLTVMARAFFIHALQNGIVPHIDYVKKSFKVV